MKYIIQTLLNPQPLVDAHLYGIIQGKGIVRHSQKGGKFPKSVFFNFQNSFFLRINNFFI